MTSPLTNLTNGIIVSVVVVYASSLSARYETEAHVSHMTERHKPCLDVHCSSPHSPQPIEMHLTDEQIDSLSQALASKEDEQDSVMMCGKIRKTHCEKNRLAYLYTLVKFLVSKSS